MWLSLSTKGKNNRLYAQQFFKRNATSSESPKPTSSGRWKTVLKVVALVGTTALIIMNVPAGKPYVPEEPKAGQNYVKDAKVTEHLDIG
jgi:hypothetical protein